MNAERKRCKQCACRMLYSTDSDSVFGCGYWGFELSPDQRACDEFTTDSGKVHQDWPLGQPMQTVGFPEAIVTRHNLSDGKYKLEMRTACVRGKWYASCSYSRFEYGRTSWVSVYDGTYDTERDAINAQIRSIIRDEQCYHNADAIAWLKTKLFEQRQLTLFDV